MTKKKGHGDGGWRGPAPWARRGKCHSCGRPMLEGVPGVKCFTCSTGRPRVIVRPEERASRKGVYGALTYSPWSVSATHMVAA